MGRLFFDSSKNYRNSLGDFFLYESDKIPKIALRSLIYLIPLSTAKKSSCLHSLLKSLAIGGFLLWELLGNTKGTFQIQKLLDKPRGEN